MLRFFLLPHVLTAPCLNQVQKLSPRYIWIRTVNKFEEMRRLSRSDTYQFWQAQLFRISHNCR